MITTTGVLTCVCGLLQELREGRQRRRVSSGDILPSSATVRWKPHTPARPIGLGMVSRPIPTFWPERRVGARAVGRGCRGRRATARRRGAALP